MSIPGDPPNHPSEPHQPPPAAPPGGAGQPFAAPGTPADSVSFGAPSTSVLPDGSVAPPRRRKRNALIGGTVAAVLVVGGGVVWAVSTFAAGGGAQPETVVPSNAIAFVRVDLDPSAGQKLAAYRFLQKFPSVDKQASEGDLLDQVLSTVFEDADGVDYATDIKPWVGKRMAVAAVPQADGSGVDPLVVVQVDDEEKARTTLRRLLDEDAAASGSGGGSFDPEFSADYYSAEPTAPQGLVVRDGYALVSTDQAITERLSAAAVTANLSDAPTYSADLDRLGEPGIATVWVDLDAAQSELEDAGLSSALPTGTTGGRLTAALRFGGGNAEVVARTTGGTATATATAGQPAGAMLQALPADITGAIAVGNTETYVDSIATALESVGTLALGTGLSDVLGPDYAGDLRDLFGSGFVLAVGDVLESGEVGMRVRTTDPAASTAALTNLLDAGNDRTGGFVGVGDIAHADAADGVVHAFTPEFAAALAQAGTLGQSPEFVAAVPDAATATSAGYVNFDRVRDQVDDAETTANLEPLRSLGLTVRTTGGEAELRVTLVAR